MIGYILLAIIFFTFKAPPRQFLYFELYGYIAVGMAIYEAIKFIKEKTKI